METIKAVYGIQPILDIKTDKNGSYGLNRDRIPDSGWSEFRNTNMKSDSIKEVPFDSKMKQIYIEDVCAYFGEKAFGILNEKKLLNI